ncbi:MAG: hypothetical protein DMG16_14700 [Acidobacteria bacterium]|nr:MAG: hypothetical protein DMG16_14700 [Acidobacteriota bacterium]
MFETIVVGGLILQLLTFVTLCFFLVQLLRQQGRILLRLDGLEEGRAAPAAGPGPKGLAVGTAVEDCRLPDLNGQTISLSDYRGRRVLLIYWSAECGFCDLTAAELAPIQSRLQNNNTEVVMVSYGSAESNRKLAAEHGLSSTILLLKDAPAQKIFENGTFQYCGTPSAYLLDEQGHVAQPLAAGMDQVLLLARQAAARDGGADVGTAKRVLRTLLPSESRIEREGLKKGASAPGFSLPDIHGQTVSLDQFRGRKVLLVFTDPQCGPCDELAADLVRLDRKHGNNGLAVIMVGRGDAEQNKKKASEHGIRFPVVLQERWKLSREYGIFATPVAFLIGKDGVLMRNVAKGPDQIMALARAALALEERGRRPGEENVTIRKTPLLS